MDTNTLFAQKNGGKAAIVTWMFVSSQVIAPIPV